MEERICKNCNNYILYYCKVKGTFKQISIGHCILDNRKKRLAYFCTCDKWESNMDAIQKSHESIENTLLKMAKDLNYISQILKEEKLL